MRAAVTERFCHISTEAKETYYDVNRDPKETRFCPWPMLSTGQKTNEQITQPARVSAVGFV
jgi:hypothetical protein